MRVNRTAVRLSDRWFCAIALCHLPVPLGAAVYLVGPSADGACTHTTVHAAVLSAVFNPGADEVRIATSQSYNAFTLTLTDFPDSLILSGGWPSCSAPAATGTTTLAGNTSQPVIRIETTTGNSQITLRNLVLAGTDTTGVAGLSVDGPGSIHLQGVTVQNHGGSGMVVMGSGTFVHLDATSLVQQNRGVDGGGIRITDSAQVFLNGGTVFDNEATRGGGVFAGAGARLNLGSGAWIVSNSAATGGGVALTGGGSIFPQVAPIGDTQRGILGNQASGDGGGLHLEGSGTSAVLTDTIFNGNVAAVRGGGIFATDEALVLMNRHENCGDDSRCSAIESGALTIGNQGAAVFAEGGADVAIENTEITGNGVALGATLGSILHAAGTGTALSVTSSALRFNRRGDTLFEATSGALVETRFVTAADNDWNCPAGTCPASPLITSGAATVGRLYSGIFWPSDPVSALSGSTIQARCLVLSTTSGLPGTATFVATADPQLVGAGDWWYRLKPGSPAVDFCDDFVAPATDIEGEARGHDLPASANGSPGVPGGVYDLGADELWPLFADGFESGTGCSWSSGPCV